jgi:hypothetical protein
METIAALFLFDCSSYKFTLIQILKENVFITQPKKRNNNLMSTILLNDIILKCSLIEFNFKVSVVVTS